MLLGVEQGEMWREQQYMVTRLTFIFTGTSPTLHAAIQSLKQLEGHDYITTTIDVEIKAGIDHKVHFFPNLTVISLSSKFQPVS